jgi:hypothetical protein
MTDYKYFCVSKVHHTSTENGTCVNGGGTGAAPGTPKGRGCGLVSQRQGHKNQQHIPGVVGMLEAPLAQ